MEKSAFITIGTYFCFMRRNMQKRITYNGKTVLAIIVPEHRQNGMHYEVNVKGFPRFYMAWSPIGRYDIASQPDGHVPYELILAVSDAIEEIAK